METLARLTYNIERRAQARARRQEKKRGKLHGNAKPSHPRKKGLRKRIEKAPPNSGLILGDLGEIALEDLAKEIEGTGGFGPGDVRFASTPTIHEFPGVPSSFRLRFSYMNDARFGDMIQGIRAQPREGEIRGHRPRGEPYIGPAP